MPGVQFQFQLWLWHALGWVRARAAGECERGDVPGWVLITGMTVALCMMVWGVASGSLSSLLSGFFSNISFSGGGKGGGPEACGGCLAVAITAPSPALSLSLRPSPGPGPGWTQSRVRRWSSSCWSR